MWKTYLLMLQRAAPTQDRALRPRRCVAVACIVVHVRGWLGQEHRGRGRGNHRRVHSSRMPTCQCSTLTASAGDGVCQCIEARVQG